MTDLPYMPMYWERFFSDTELMPAETRALYAILLGRMWTNHGWLPNDDSKIARLLGLDTRAWKHRHKAAIMPLLRGDIDPLLGPIIRQKRLAAELEKATDLVAKRRAQTAAATAERLRKTGKGGNVTSLKVVARNVDRNVARSDAIRAPVPEPQEPQSKSDCGSGPLTPAPARPPAVEASGLAGPFVPSTPQPPAPVGKTRFLDAYEKAAGDMNKLPVLPGAPAQPSSGHMPAQSTWDAAMQRFVPARPPPGTTGRDARQQAAAQPAERTPPLAASPLVKRMAADAPPDPAAFAEEAKAALKAQQEEHHGRAEHRDPDPDLDDFLKF